MGVNIKIGRHALSSTLESPPKQSLVTRSRANHGQMAPLRRKLVCFYCNKKSDIKYDGHITQWECINCDSVNYLDENGDITDPPVALAHDAHPAPMSVQYATRTESPDYIDSNTVFCTRCIKNQHLYTSSLREYEFDIEELFSKNVYDYVQAEKEIAKFKNGLEARYPQVCADCEPRVLERLKTAKRTAQTDHIGRLLKKTKERRNTAQNGLLSVRTFERIGKWSCLIGIFGQLLWHAITLLNIAEHNYSIEIANSTMLSSIIALRVTIISTLTSILQPAYALLLNVPYLSSLISNLTWDSLPKYSLIVTLPSLPWSPKLREAAHGFLTHINGYVTYYKLQLMLFSLRVSFYLLMGTKLFSDPFAPITAGSHLIMPCFVILIAYKMKHCVKVDIGPLFAVPDKINFVGPPSGSPMEKESSIEITRKLITSGRRIPEPKLLGTDHGKLANSFDQASSPLNYSQKLHTSLSPKTYVQDGEVRQRFTSNTFNQAEVPRRPAPYSQQEEYGRLSSSLKISRTTTPPFTLMSDTEQSQYLATGETPARLHDVFNENPAEEMEWSPTRSKSLHRAFNPTSAGKTAAQTTTNFGQQLVTDPQHPFQKSQFNQIPVAERPSNFWFKVPPAPIAPAHRLRNPPNQPKLRVSSPEAKQNFFNDVTRQSQLGDSLSDPSPSDFFNQQTFFPNQVASGEGEDLADLFGGFSLSKTNPTAQKPGRNWAGVIVPTLLVLTAVIYGYLWIRP